MTDPEEAPPASTPTDRPGRESRTDPRTGQDARSPRKFELSPAQVTGSALAAMTGAFLASYLGTAGTVIGAAVGSLIATVGTTAYTWWLRRTSEVVKRTATQVRETGWAARSSSRSCPARAGRAGPTAAGTSRNGASEDEQDAGSGTGDDGPGDDGPVASRRRPVATAPAATGPTAGSGRGTGRGARSRWWPRPSPSSSWADSPSSRAITGKPLSSYTKGGDQTGTSVGHLVGNNPTPTPKPTPTPTPSPTPTPTPSATPTSTDASHRPRRRRPTPSTTPTDLPTPAPPRRSPRRASGARRPPEPGRPEQLGQEKLDQWECRSTPVGCRP